jgi:hypothetical protein
MLAVAAVTSVTLVAWASPALAQRPDAGTRGSFGGVAVALVLGALFAIVIVVLAYRDVRFGTEDAHHEDAHDIREGVDAHEPAASGTAAEETHSEERGMP